MKWRDAFERAIKTAIQSGAAAAVTTLVANPSDLQHTDWVYVGGVTAMATILSLLMSISSGIKPDTTINKETNSDESQSVEAPNSTDV